MAKQVRVFVFKGYNEEKVYGDGNSPELIVTVKNALNKADAKAVAAKAMGGLRMFSGASVKESAVETEIIAMYQKQGVRCISINVDTQRALGALLLPA